MNQSNCKYILDTNVFVDLLRDGNQNIAQKIREVGISSCCISDITLYELYCGAIYAKNPKKEKERIENICSNLEILPISDHIMSAINQKEYLKKNGTMIPDFDIMIGTTGVDKNYTVVTNDSHLKLLQGIKTENWSSPAP